MSREDPTTTPETLTGQAEDGSDRSEHTCVIARTPVGMQIVALPSAGTIVFGRSRHADVHLADARLSRRHVAIEIAGGALTIRDLGSRNGTRVNGTAITAPTRLAIGDRIELGETTLYVDRVRGGGVRVLEHDVFVAEARRLELALAPLALVLLEVHGLPIERRASFVAAIARSLRPHDFVGAYSLDELEVLLVDADRAAAERTAQALEITGRAFGATVASSIAAPPDARGIDALMEHARAGLDARRRAAHDPRASANPSIVVSDPAMKELYALVERVARGTISVLVLGETGAGKELVAQALHDASPRARRPLVKINCATMRDTLLESELFGHERGAFTGADRAKKGILEIAEGGTVFLDEVGELDPQVQAKLLRALEAKQVTPVGGLVPRSIDIRLVAATNRDLEAAVAAGTFRSDLLFRLNGVVLRVPPLRERQGEIMRLAETFMRRCASDLGRHVPSLSDDARAALLRYSWPGNVRELRNAIERAVLVTDGDEITSAHLPDLGRSHARVAPASPQAVPPAAMGAASLGDELRALEQRRILEALESCGWNQTRAAAQLGMPRRTLVLRIAQFGLRRP